MNSESKNKAIIGGGLAAVVIAIGLYFWLREKPAEPEPPAPAPVAAVEQPEHHQVPEETPKRAALPELAESDSVMTDALKALFSAKTVEQNLVPQDIVRHIVVSIDNLPRKKLAERLKPIKPVAGRFAVTGPEEARMLSEDNYTRYQPLVQLASTTDMQQVAAVYFKFYPLFQQAYTDLGYPSGYFNDRLVEVIDHLLATPDVAGPIKLTQPGVMYEYADAKLENLSSGQKILIRMGKANAAALKTKLRELRAAVTKKTD
jgi:Protein of unknown function (DUF3014)